MDSMTQKNYGVIDKPEELQHYVDKLIGDGKPFGFDIETGYYGPARNKASLHPEEAFIVGYSFTNSLDWARYVPLQHDMSVNMDLDEFAAVVWPLMQTGLGIAHNARFELRFLQPFFAEHTDTNGEFTVFSDTMIESYMLQETQSHALKELTKIHFGHEQAELHSLFPELAKNKQKAIRFNVLELTPQVVSYACEDSLWCLALHEKLYERVRNELLYKTEMAILPVVVEMERYGVQYDWRMMEAAAVDLKQFIVKWHGEIMAELSAHLGEPVNINLAAPAQISNVLFNRMGYKTTRMTKSSKDSSNPRMSTDKIALAGLAKQFPVVKRIVQWKEMYKLLGTYLTEYEKKFSYASDHRTHPSITQARILTGRFAVEDPPYQQTPKKYHFELSTGEVFDLNFRDIIRSSPGNYLLSFDYSQVELRWLAGVAQEPTLLRDFTDGVDVHSRTASLMLNVPIENVTEDQRAVGKTMNFALLYGMGAKSLGERLGISKTRAEELYEQYFSAFSSIAVWSARTVEEGKRNGYTMSHFGRHQTIWELKSKENWIRSKGERMCVNAPIQGGAADYMKIAMVRAHGVLQKAGMLDRVHLIMNIHDALIYEVERPLNVSRVVEVLEPAVSFRVKGFPPIKADWSIGYKWGSMKAVEIRNGKIWVSGAVREAAPTVDEDGELEDDALVVAPEVLAEAKVEAVQRPAEWPVGPRPSDVPPEPEGDPDAAHDLIIEVQQMPDELQCANFMDLLRSRPGYNTVTLVTPEGDLHYSQTTSLGPKQSSSVSMIFTGAQVTYAAGSVNSADVLAGLTL